MSGNPARANVPLLRLAASLALICSVPNPEGPFAQDGPERLPSGALGHLIWPRTGSHVAHYSSHDRAGGNADFVSIAPGETFTLVDHEGAGVLRRWWLTISPRNDPDIQRGLIVRCYWDGEELPSVEVPVSDYFGMGFGLWKDYVSLPVNMTSGGYNSYWPMPFKERARMVVENTSDVPIERFYYNNYGIVRLLANGEPLRPLVDGYSPAVERSDAVSFGTVMLDGGANEITVELIGKDARAAGYSDGYLVGIDGFLLREIER